MSNTIGNPTQNAFFAARAAENRARMEAENAARAPRTCECGRGSVATVFGCMTCNQEASRVFVANMMTDKVARHR